MATIHHDTRQLDVKVVYYGPALSGKTTNLTTLQGILGPDRTSPLLSIDTQEDRTLFFDLLPVDLGTVRGFGVRFRLFTVPGQVVYAATRRVVLSGADGVVLVLDSDPARAPENAAAVADLHESLQANRLDPAVVPVVVQWNKQDVPGCRAVPDLAQTLLPWSPLAVGAVATAGRGVRETFVSILELSLARLAERLGMPELGATASTLRQRIEAIPAPAAPQRGTLAVRRLRMPGGPSGRETIPIERQAIMGIVASAEEAARRDDERRQAARERDRMRELAALSERLLGDDAEPEVLRDAVRFAMAQVRADGGLLLRRDATGTLRAAVLEGVTRSPLPAEAVETLLLRARDLVLEDLAAELTRYPVTDGDRVFFGGIYVRVGASGEEAGALLLLGANEHAPLDATALPVLRLLAAQLGLFLTGQRLRARVSTSRKAWLQTVDALEDLLYVVDHRFVLRRVNQAFARATGHTPAALVGRRCHEVLQNRETPCATCFLRPILEGRQLGAAALELQGYLPGRSLEARAVPLDEGSSAEPLALATLHDVSARKAMARELVESEKLAGLGRLAAGMSHEVNNPLAFIQGNLDYLRELLAGPFSAQTRSDASAAVKDAGEGVERVRRVVAQLARYAPRHGGARVPLDLLQLARQSAQLARDECSRPGVGIRLAGQPLPIAGLPGELGVIVRVLVKNAIEASPAGGTVTISVAVVDGMPRIAVHDDGPGIPPEVRVHLFEPFFTTKPPGKHMGLSLAMAHAVARAMEATLKVDGSPSQGTTFLLELPSSCRKESTGTSRPVAALPARRL